MLYENLFSICEYENPKHLTEPSQESYKSKKALQNLIQKKSKLKIHKTPIVQQQQKYY